MSSIRLQRSRAVSTRVQHLCSAASALPLAIALCVSPAAAQTSDAVHHGDAITVTGVRQAYRGDFALREIPQSIAEIDAETLQQNNILRLTDALDMNASVARQNTLGGLWDSFAIRGFAGDENLPSGYLVNGFNAGRGFGASLAGRSTWSPNKPRSAAVSAPRRCNMAAMTGSAPTPTPISP